jgi:hypothetical protein
VLAILHRSLAALGVFVSALPAGVITHFLPPNVSTPTICRAASGTARSAKSRSAGRDAGAVEWRSIRPLLLHFAIKARFALGLPRLRRRGNRSRSIAAARLERPARRRSDRGSAGFRRRTRLARHG